MERLNIELDAGTSMPYDLADYISSEFEDCDVQLPGDLSDSLEPVSVLIIVTSGVISVGVVAAVADWIRQRNECLLVIDARGAEVTITERCDLPGQRGKIVVLSSSDQKLTVDAPRGVFDIEAIVNTLIDKSIDAASVVAHEAGLRNEIGPIDPTL